jgi:hypothetical protein
VDDVRLASRQYRVGHDSTGHSPVGGEGSVSTTAARRHPPAPTERDAAVPPDALPHFGDERVRDRRLATDGRFVDASDSQRTRALAAASKRPGRSDSRVAAVPDERLWGHSLFEGGPMSERCFAGRGATGSRACRLRIPRKQPRLLDSHRSESRRHAPAGCRFWGAGGARRRCPQRFASASEQPRWPRGRQCRRRLVADNTGHARLCRAAWLGDTLRPPRPAENRWRARRSGGSCFRLARPTRPASEFA